MIKVMIKRKAPKEKETELLSLITQLRSEASQATGLHLGRDAPWYR